MAWCMICSSASVRKPKKVAAVACMRKYLTRLNAMKRDNAPWKSIPMAA